MSVTFEVLAPLGDPDLRLIVYRAADVPSQHALDRIIEVRSEHPDRHLHAL